MEFNFTKENILRAIDYLDQHPEEFKGRTSVKYDLTYNDKLYPPILVLSKANELGGGNEVTIRDFNNSTEKAFKHLTEHGFKIIEKEGYTSFAPLLYQFLEQSKTSNLSHKNYSINYLDTKVKASFGQGGVANIPWISFLINPNTTSKGIYPVYLFFKKESLLILAYGISETNLPSYNWDESATKLSINKLFQERDLGKPFRYGGSYVYKTYDVDDLPSSEELDSDLTYLLSTYHETMSHVENITKPSFTDMILFKNNSFIESLEDAHLQFNDTLVKRFVGSLITKPFVILTGLAGSGKTKLAQSFIQWICESDEQFKIVPVGADWINREPLLGYPNGLKSDEYVMPDNGLLTLILNASQEENQQKPYFLLLDEMNLSHVERYFADFLSIMESQDTIKLYEGEERNSTDGEEIPKTISWPKNLFIIGTVNIDETTYMFSPKVLDRANVIEFRLDQEDLDQYLENPKKIDLSALVGQGSSMASNFVELSQLTDIISNDNLNIALKAFFSELKTVGAEFGYRTAFEIQVLFSQLSTIDVTLAVDDKIDYAVMQKLLPKLHGSRSKIVKTLEALLKLCLTDGTTFSLDKLDQVDDENIRYKVSFEKLKRMYFNAINNGFTSYAEA